MGFAFSDRLLHANWLHATEADCGTMIESRPHHDELRMIGARLRTTGQEPTAAEIVLEAAAADDAETGVTVAAEAFCQLPHVAAR